MATAVAGDKIKLPKAAKVRNKAPAPVQITAEQLLREAKERDLEIVPPEFGLSNLAFISSIPFGFSGADIKNVTVQSRFFGKANEPPKQKISDPEELAAYQLKRRKEFEDNIRKNRSVISNWIKYAKWEESQDEMQRTRSIYERALDVDHRNISLWLQYAEMEMRARQVNHARNIWDRAVTILPRAEQFWYKYAYMEEMLGNYPGCRQVFERWMEWEPGEQAWQTFINFELRYKEVDRARDIYQRFIHCHPDVKNWIRYAKFEEHKGSVSNARQVYEQAVNYFGEDHVDEKLLSSFAKFEEAQKEHERARVIYRYALDRLSKDKTTDIYKAYTIHEKKYGERSGIETVVVSKRKSQYESQIQENPYNYDVWFDYLRLLENEDADIATVREVYERAISNIPPQQEKRFWRRYIYFWINYALYEELIAKDVEKAREVYKACLELIPHKKFTFAKIWLMSAQFEVRQKNLAFARRILGASIGKCPKDKLFRGYIDIELQLREFDRCRVLYQKFLEFSPENCTTWVKFGELETLLGDVERARAIYELAIQQPVLDMPEVLWKAYVDFEVGQENWANARKLYHRLLQRTKHVKVWISFAQFELSVDENENRVAASREVYRKAHRALKDSEDKEERLMLLEAWKKFEEESGDAGSVADVLKEMPKRVKKRRKIETQDGSDAGWEEYFDYIFPSDESAQSNLKLLEMAKRWKQKQAGGEGEDDDEEPSAQTSAPPAAIGGDSPRRGASSPAVLFARRRLQSEGSSRSRKSEEAESENSDSETEDMRRKLLAAKRKDRAGDSDTDISSSSEDEPPAKGKRQRLDDD